MKNEMSDTEYLVWCPEAESEEDAVLILARNPADAAEGWAMRRDQQGEYEIASGNPVEVCVLAGSTRYRFRVSVPNWDPPYKAEEIL